MAEPIFYWNQGCEQHGPFTTLEEAKADIRAKANPQPTVNLNELMIAEDYHTGIYDPDLGAPVWPND